MHSPRRRDAATVHPAVWRAAVWRKSPHVEMFSGWQIHVHTGCVAVHRAPYTYLGWRWGDAVTATVHRWEASTAHQPVRRAGQTLFATRDGHMTGQLVAASPIVADPAVPTAHMPNLAAPGRLVIKASKDGLVRLGDVSGGNLRSPRSVHAPDQLKRSQCLALGAVHALEGSGPRPDRGRNVNFGGGSGGVFNRNISARRPR